MLLLLQEEKCNYNAFPFDNWYLFLIYHVYKQQKLRSYSLVIFHSTFRDFVFIVDIHPLE